MHPRGTREWAWRPDFLPSVLCLGPTFLVLCEGHGVFSGFRPRAARAAEDGFFEPGALVGGASFVGGSVQVSAVGALGVGGARTLSSGVLLWASWAGGGHGTRRSYVPKSPTRRALRGAHLQGLDVEAHLEQLDEPRARSVKAEFGAPPFAEPPQVHDGGVGYQPVPQKCVAIPGVEAADSPAFLSCGNGREGVNLHLSQFLGPEEGPSGCRFLCVHGQDVSRKVKANGRRLPGHDLLHVAGDAQPVLYGEFRLSSRTKQDSAGAIFCQLRASVSDAILCSRGGLFLWCGLTTFESGLGRLSDGLVIGRGEEGEAVVHGQGVVHVIVLLLALVVIIGGGVGLLLRLVPFLRRGGGRGCHAFRPLAVRRGRGEGVVYVRSRRAA